MSKQKSEDLKDLLIARTSFRFMAIALFFILLAFVSYFISETIETIFGIPNGDANRYNILLVFLECYSALVSFTAVVWAIQDYWRLRHNDRRGFEKEIRDLESEDGSGKQSEFPAHNFHVIAEAHKEWAQLWFSWCVAIFAAGVTFAIFNIGLHHQPCLAPFSKNTTWEEVVNMLAPNIFVYFLFGVAWNWASKHYRSHWHNFVVNAYKYRALRVLKIIREEIMSNFTTGDYRAPKVEDTILELYRISGILLLIQSESSYLDNVASDEISKTVHQLDELARTLIHPGKRD
jgi:hypothetical protein